MFEDKGEEGERRGVVTAPRNFLLWNYDVKEEIFVCCCCCWVSEFLGFNLHLFFFLLLWSFWNDVCGILKGKRKGFPREWEKRILKNRKKKNSVEVLKVRKNVMRLLFLSLSPFSDFIKEKKDSVTFDIFETFFFLLTFSDANVSIVDLLFVAVLQTKIFYIFFFLLQFFLLLTNGFCSWRKKNWFDLEKSVWEFSYFLLPRSLLIIFRKWLVEENSKKKIERGKKFFFFYCETKVIIMMMMTSTSSSLEKKRKEKNSSKVH